MSQLRGKLLCVCRERHKHTHRRAYLLLVATYNCVCVSVSLSVRKERKKEVRILGKTSMAGHVPSDIVLTDDICVTGENRNTLKFKINLKGNGNFYP